MSRLRPWLVAALLALTLWWLRWYWIDVRPSEPADQKGLGFFVFGLGPYVACALGLVLWSADLGVHLVRKGEAQAARRRTLPLELLAFTLVAAPLFWAFPRIALAP